MSGCYAPFRCHGAAKPKLPRVPRGPYARAVMPAPPRRVLFVCATNSCPSQMAEAWLRHLGGDSFVVRSAGADPSHIHPLAVRAMQEAGIDMSAQRGKGIDAYRSERFDLVVTLAESVRGAAPLPRATSTIHRDFDDPSWLEDAEGGDLDEYRRLREALREFVMELLAGH